MQEIQIFNNPDFGEIRTIIINDEPWFGGKDIAKALGYARPDNAVTDRTEDEDRIFVDKKLVLELGISFDYKELGQRGGWLINESGMYALIFDSKLESAKKFKKWVTSEVLPSIRKTGSYGQQKTTQEQITLLAQGTTELYQRVESAENRLTDLEDTMTIDYGQQTVLEDAVNKTVMSHLGGKGSPAYKGIGRKVFAECNRDLKHYFKVNARANVPRKRYDEAVAYAENWKPCTNTVMAITEYNAQQCLDI